MGEFTYATWSVQALVSHIETGSLALPELQRPFVWQTTKVRDLLDSMYKGFPVGQIMLWESGAEPGAKRIGDPAGNAPQFLVVDGQQRLTSLYAVTTGKEIVDSKYKKRKIIISFNPFTERFEVANPATRNASDWVYDVSELFAKPIEYLLSFGKRDLKRDDEEITQALTVLSNVSNLVGYNFSIVQLSESLDEEEVADIFVRINSEGVNLGSADFVLTLMSVYWETGRIAIEKFTQAAMAPSLDGTASPFNWHIRPAPTELLRVITALGLRRGSLKDSYIALRGRDRITGKVDTVKRRVQFDLLAEAQSKVLDLSNWSEIPQFLERAGFRSEKMISSRNAILYSYVMWLIGKTEFGISKLELRNLIAKWFFMAQLTSRYAGSFETLVDQDLATLAALPKNEPNGFRNFIDHAIKTTLSDDFWTSQFPIMLETSGPRSPAILGYFAALNILDAEVLLSHGRIRSHLDPSLTFQKGIERHHLFPKKFLKSKLSVSNQRDINQAANIALVDWIDNIDISDLDPKEYWQLEVGKHQITEEQLSSQMYWHALPPAWFEMDYFEFTSARRDLMAQVTRDAFIKLNDLHYDANYPAPTNSNLENLVTRTPRPRVKISDLLDAGLIQEGDLLVPVNPNIDGIGEISDSGSILIDQHMYDTPSEAAKGLSGISTNGWIFWKVGTQDDVILDELRKKFESSRNADF